MRDWLMVFMDAILKYFWGKVDKSGGEDACWWWKGAIHNNGYGKVSIQYNKYTAHRVSMSLHLNRSLTSIEFVCHTCDNPLCVNPRHLYIGDAKTNVQDMVKRGRNNNGAYKGKITHNTKLNFTKAQEIRSLIAEEVPIAHISRLYGVGRKAIYDIKYNETWLCESPPKKNKTRRSYRDDFKEKSIKSRVLSS